MERSLRFLKGPLSFSFVASSAQAPPRHSRRAAVTRSLPATGTRSVIIEVVLAGEPNGRTHARTLFAAKRLQTVPQTGNPPGIAHEPSAPATRRLGVAHRRL